MADSGGKFEILRIQSFKFQKSLKRDAFIIGSMGTFLLCTALYIILSVGFSPIPILLLVVAISKIFVTVSYIDLYFESLIVYNNGFTKGKSKFNTKLFGESKFINFEKVNDIVFLEDRIKFVLRNKKEIYIAINNQNEYHIILEAFRKCKKKVTIN